jgi:mannose-6-phosphate isomerase-like protein (cupin superfamily)
MLSFDERPWGKWEEYLNEESYRVKRNIVHPGKRLSLQKHLYRSENWVIVLGNGVFTLNDIKKDIKTGDVMNIPVNNIHRIENTGTCDLIFIETQMGKCIESDIVRLEDDWGRN